MATLKLNFSPDTQAKLARLAPVQRIAQVIKGLRHWIAEQLGVEQRADLTEKARQTETFTQFEKIAPVRLSWQREQRPMCP